MRRSRLAERGCQHGAAVLYSVVKFWHTLVKFFVSSTGDLRRPSAPAYGLRENVGCLCPAAVAASSVADAR